MNNSDFNPWVKASIRLPENNHYKAIRVFGMLYTAYFDDLFWITDNNDKYNIEVEWLDETVIEKLQSELTEYKKSFEDKVNMCATLLAKTEDLQSENVRLQSENEKLTQQLKEAQENNNLK